jgi:hypothetical protein
VLRRDRVLSYRTPVQKLLILALVVALPLGNVANATHWCWGDDSASVAGPVVGGEHSDHQGETPSSGHAGHCDVCGHGLGFSLIPFRLVAPALAAHVSGPVIRDLSVVASPLVDRIDEPPR